MKQELASIFPIKFSSVKLSKNITTPSKSSMNFYGIFIRDFKFIRGAIIKSNVQNSKKQVKNEKKLQRKRSRPKGKWILDHPNASGALD
jgi:hypothetical protein